MVFYLKFEFLILHIFSSFPLLPFAYIFQVHYSMLFKIFFFLSFLFYRLLNFFDSNFPFVFYLQICNVFSYFPFVNIQFSPLLFLSYILFFRCPPALRFFLLFYIYFIFLIIFCLFAHFSYFYFKWFSFSFIICLILFHYLHQFIISL